MLKVVYDMTESGSCGPSSRCYKQLRVVDDMNNSRSHELMALDSMDNLGL